VTNHPFDQTFHFSGRCGWRFLAFLLALLGFPLAVSLLFGLGETLLIRGGTSSLGLAALQLAKSVGATVISTTRNKNKAEYLKEMGSNYALLDDESLSEQLFAITPTGVNKVLELVGTVTLKHSLSLVAENGILCLSGILGNEWELDRFEPLVDIPTGVYLTAFTSETIKEHLLVELFNHIEKHDIQVPIAKVFMLDQIHEAHLLMESNAANGKIVVMNT
jgi:NADPH2:quinone reductase